MCGRAVEREFEKVDRIYSAGACGEDWQGGAGKVATVDVGLLEGCRCEAGVGGVRAGVPGSPWEGDRWHLEDGGFYIGVVFGGFWWLAGWSMVSLVQRRWKSRWASFCGWVENEVLEESCAGWTLPWFAVSR